jgi:hypothetical protein
MQLFDLPIEILGVEVFSWMDERSLVGLDMAVTSTLSREGYLQAYTYLPTHCIDKLSDNIIPLKMMWLSKRGIKLSSVVVAKRLSAGDLTSVLKGLNSSITTCLEHIQFNGNKELRDSHLFILARISRDLKTVDLWNCNKITDLGLIRLVENSPNLTDVSLWQHTLSHCRSHSWDPVVKISNFSIHALITNCPNLANLNLSSCCSKLTDEAIYSLCRHKVLKTLDLSWNSDHLSDSALLILSRSCPSLTTLKIGGRCRSRYTILIEEALHRYSSCHVPRS